MTVKMILTMNNDPLLLLIYDFIESPQPELVITVPKGGTILEDGTKFLDCDDFTPQKVFKRVYDLCARAGILRTKVFVHQRGNEVHIVKDYPLERNEKSRS